MIERFKQYARTTPPFLVFFDILRAFLLVFAAVLGILVFRWISSQGIMVAPLHRRLWANPEFTLSGWVYGSFWVIGFVSNTAWISLAVRNFATITMKRREPTDEKAKEVEREKFLLPPWPYRRDSFSLILGELQDRDGSRVPNEGKPEIKPRWMILPELSLYTGVFVTGGIGSGKTAAVAYPCLNQMIGFDRPVHVRTRSGELREDHYRFSGLIQDEKGDFMNAAKQFSKNWGREEDIITLSPGGDWMWNVVYNPNLPTWAVAYQLGWIIKNFNKGATSGDPYWESAPKELTLNYLTLIYDAEGYYTLSDYLETLIEDSKQDALHEKAMNRFANDPDKVYEMERRWKAIQKRRDGMSVNLRGALESCAKSGIDMFSFPELRRTFCPSREEYFREENRLLIPRDNVFLGFDHAMDYGKIIGLQMSKQEYFDAAVFIQVALKSQWQDAVLRRDALNSKGDLVQPPRFGTQIGYCPTFLMADECQENATPRDAEFKAKCRSKRASCWEITQSHGSILRAFGKGQEHAADEYFQNSMTHVYLRQSDIPSMEKIQKEIGLKDVAETTVTVSEGGQQSELNYTQGEFVNQNLSMGSSQTTGIKEKPFLEIEELKQLPNNVAIVLPSTGEKVLPATIAYLRPSWVFKKYPKLSLETPWLDWPEELRTTYDLDNIPQDLTWSGWTLEGPLEETALVSPEDRLGSFIQPVYRVPEPSSSEAPGVQPVEETAPPIDMPGQVHLIPETDRPTPDEMQKIDDSRRVVPPEPEPFQVAEHLERHRQLAAIAEGINEEPPARRDGNPFEDFPLDDL